MKLHQALPNKQYRIVAINSKQWTDDELSIGSKIYYDTVNQNIITSTNQKIPCKLQLAQYIEVVPVMEPKTLDMLLSGQSAVIERVVGEQNVRRRLLEMGFIKGTRVSVIKEAPLKDPVEYALHGYRLTLRKEDAALIEIKDIEE